jgi:hypothetical protein
MCALRVQSPVKRFQETRPLSRPLGQVLEEKRRIQLRQPLTPQITCRRQWGAGAEPFSNLIKQTFDEWPELRIRRCPVAPYMRCDALVEMAFGYREAVSVQKCMHLVIRRRQVEDFRQRSPKLAIFN